MLTSGESDSIHEVIADEIEQVEREKPRATDVYQVSQDVIDDAQPFSNNVQVELDESAEDNILLQN